VLRVNFNAAIDGNKRYFYRYRHIFGGGMGGGMGGDDMFGGGGGNPFGGAGGFGGMPGGQRRRAGPTRQESAPPTPVVEVTRPLALTLEELYKGGTKRLKITRKRQNGTEEGKVLEIAYKAGWKKGTKVKFQGAGHEDEYGRGQTIVFVVEEKPHGRFTREDDDLVVSLNIGLLEALTGTNEGSREIEQLDGRKIKVTLPKGVSLLVPL
jgi:DnaJ family protein B protein 4